MFKQRDIGNAQVEEHSFVDIRQGRASRVPCQLLSIEVDVQNRCEVIGPQSFITDQNLARALETLRGYGFALIGLAEDADLTIEQATEGELIALVLGAEGKGLRHLTRETCDRLARLTTAGNMASLNVSNAAAIALYLARRHLESRKPAT